MAGTELQRSPQAMFQELMPSGIDLCLAHLIAARNLALTDGVLHVGPTAQATYERSYYRDLLVTFTGPGLLTGRHGSAEVGYLDPAVLVGKAD